MVAVPLVDGMGEVMVGMFCVLVDKNGVKDVLGARVVLIGMVNIVVSSGPVVKHDTLQLLIDSFLIKMRST